VILIFIAGCSDNDKRQAFTPRPFPVDQLPDDIESSAGSEDNPAARHQYDVLRFRDIETGEIPEGIRLAELEFATTLPESKGYRFKTANGRSVEADLNFTSAGPNNVGGRTRALAIDVTNTNIIFAGGVSGGLWRSTNRGTSWTRVSSVSKLPNIRSIVQDTRPGNENVWYYGTGEIEPGNSASSPAAPYRGNGIYRSNDNGITWTQVVTTGGIASLTSHFNYVHNLALDRSNLAQREMYAATIGGIFKTTNGFGSATLVLGSEDFTNDNTWTEVAVSPTGVVYATLSSEGNTNTAENGIFRSTTGDAGSWENITPPTGYNDSFRRVVIGISPSNENIVYFIGNKGDGDNVMHKYDASAAEGERWTDLTGSIPMFGGQVGDYNAQGSYNMLIAVHPEDENVVYLGGTNLYRSTNGFADTEETDWIGGYTRSNSAISYLGHHPDQHSVAFFPDNPNEMLSSHDGGVSITENNLKSTITEVTDGEGNVVDELIVVWEDLNNGYITSQFYTVAIDEENVGDPSLLGGMQDNSTYIIQNANRTQDWIDIGVGDGSYCYYDLTSAVISAQFSNIFRFALIDDQFEFFNVSPPNAGDDRLNLFVNPILLDPVIPNKAFVAGRGLIYYTLNLRLNPSGEEWLSFGSGTLPSNQRVSAMDASVEPQGILYLGTEGGRVFKIPNSSRMEEIEEVTGDNLPSGYISSIKVDPTDADKVLISYSNYNMQSIFYTTNGGETWSPVGGNLENSGVTDVGAPSVRWLSMLPNDGTPIYLAATSVGLYSTMNLNGTNTVWSQEGAGTIGTTPVDMIRVRPIDGTVVVATHGNGVFEAQADVAFMASLQALDVLCSPGEVTLQANIQLQGVENEYNLQYEWFVNGQSQSGVAGPVVTSSSEGSYSVRVTNAVTGESDMSNTVVVSFADANAQWCNDAVTSVEDPWKDEVLVYPNPTSGPVTIESPLKGFDYLTVLQLNGQVILEEPFTGTTTIQLENYKDGMYIIELKSKTEKITRRVIKISR
jgi:hypothetical protein